MSSKTTTVLSLLFCALLAACSTTPAAKVESKQPTAEREHIAVGSPAFVNFTLTISSATADVAPDNIHVLIDGETGFKKPSSYATPSPRALLAGPPPQVLLFSLDPGRHTFSASIPERNANYSANFSIGERASATLTFVNGAGAAGTQNGFSFQITRSSVRFAADSP